MGTLEAVQNLQFKKPLLAVPNELKVEESHGQQVQQVDLVQTLIKVKFSNRIAAMTAPILHKWIERLQMQDKPPNRFCRRVQLIWGLVSEAIQGQVL